VIVEVVKIGEVEKPVYVEIEVAVPRKQSTAADAQIVQKHVEQTSYVVTPLPNIVQLRKQVLKIIDQCQ
jgi:hypothetical protein